MKKVNIQVIRTNNQNFSHVDNANTLNSTALSRFIVTNNTFSTRLIVVAHNEDMFLHVDFIGSKNLIVLDKSNLQKHTIKDLKNQL